MTIGQLFLPSTTRTAEQLDLRFDRDDMIVCVHICLFRRDGNAERLRRRIGDHYHHAEQD
jgi:hypothetical protein